MISRFSVKWRWYDWLFVVVVIVVLVRLFSPASSGIAIGLHTGAVLLGSGIEWVANLFAQLLNLV